ncbi:hypothetical protein CVT24_003995 [Panaeolus cyanescens]|uniref:Pentacotripeptide-repeat region of PRORP domain-containing protein n=1 Tax=Panaeolus cyanescens TaxID=181874 RepID=A0A409Y643_9AGAR|nr:hypothetical protein CVT24_003995 [Panaeolus cyanescens]
MLTPKTRLLSFAQRQRQFINWINTHHYANFTSQSSDQNNPQLPRFLRRQSLQKQSPEKQLEQPASSATKHSVQKQYRSRHYDPDKKPESTSEIRLLEPHVLSARLKKLCDAGKIDDAVHMLKNAPLDAQNTPVWNTLIWETLKAKRYQLSYQLYVDMKRKGFSPSIRTFQTFFNGLSKIENWSVHTKQLNNARSFYEQYRRHVASVKRSDPNDPSLSIDPLAGYIRILGNAGHYQEVFDVFYAMDKEGPLAPNQFIFTAMFQAIVAARGDTPEGSTKVAADAKLLWSQMIKASKKGELFTPDSHTVVAAITALTGGTEPYHDMAFDIISQYYGLERNQPISKPGKLVLQPEALFAILKFCNSTKNYQHTTQFWQQVKRRPDDIGGISILDRGHAEEVIKATLALREPGVGYHSLDILEWMLRMEITSANGPKIRPALSTYSLVMQACWRGGEWSSALRTFELMTGYHSHDFMDGSVAAVPRLDKRGQGRSLPPNAEFISSMVRAALIRRNRADVRQALRIVDYLGFGQLVSAREESSKGESLNRALKNKSFYAGKLAASIIDAFDFIMEDNGKYAKPEEAAKWRALAAQAREYTAKAAQRPSSKPRAPRQGSLDSS